MMSMNSHNTENISADVSNLPSGIYMLTVSNAEQVINKKFMKE